MTDLAEEIHMSAPLCFIDTETTGLHPGRRAWEVAIIRREPDGVETEWLSLVADVDLSAADPFGLQVGRFYERHPAYNGSPPDSGRYLYGTEVAVAAIVERLTRGAHLVGAVPNFDAEVIADMLRRHRLTPAWHYHLIDVEALAVGYLSAARKMAGHADSGLGPAETDAIGQIVGPPWKSDDLSRAVGVEPASDEDRHTALGDARWARRIYDKVTGSAALSTTSAHASARPNVHWID